MTWLAAPMMARTLAMMESGSIHVGMGAIFKLLKKVKW
jgi:hypothetical protein